MFRPPYLYAASAWRALTRASDLQRINSVIVRDCRRHGYCPANLPTFEKLCDAADDELFSKVIRLPSHVLHARTASATDHCITEL